MDRNRRTEGSPTRGRGVRLTGLCVWLGISMVACERDTAPSPPPESEAVAPSEVPLTLETATTPRELAMAACSSCHLFPDPSLLDSNTWVQFALPHMEPWLGLAPAERERDRQGDYVLPEDTFAQTPLLSLEQWASIREFYASQAPAALPPPPMTPPLLGPTERFRVREFPYFRPAAMTALVKIDASRQRLLVGDAVTRTLESRWADGRLDFTVEFDSTPISVRLRDSGMDLATVGRLFPSDLPRGRVLSLTREGEEVQITPILEGLRRPTHVAYGDLNQDGREDMVVCQFGHRTGRVSWFEATESGDWKEHVWLDQAGAICSVIADLNQDDRPDVVVLQGQAWEGVRLFLNRGDGDFIRRDLIARPPTFGYSWMEGVDFNGDGHLDFLTSNGDNGDLISPFKSYHGVRLLMNDGKMGFRELFLYPLDGAYKAMPADFDGDGDMDIVAISWFANYGKSLDAGAVYLENRGNNLFTPWTLPESQTGRWLTMDAGDLDGDGDTDLVLGCLTDGPTTTPIPERLSQRWVRQPRAILVLENTTH